MHRPAPRLNAIERTRRLAMRKVALAAVILFAAGCDGGPTGPSVDVRVSGRILDFATNAGVPGAAVTFGESTTVTDADGSYTLVIPMSGRFDPVVDGRSMGSSQVTGSAYRGDFFVHPGICVARYGTVTDARTLRPIAGATVSLGDKRVISENDGWYRIDLGCPTSPFPGLAGIGTTFINISHPNFAGLSRVIGRGVFSVYRADFELQRR